MAMTCEATSFVHCKFACNWHYFRVITFQHEVHRDSFLKLSVLTFVLFFSAKYGNATEENVEFNVQTLIAAGVDEDNTVIRFHCL